MTWKTISNSSISIFFNSTKYLYFQAIRKGCFFVGYVDEPIHADPRIPNSSNFALAFGNRVAVAFGARIAPADDSVVIKATETSALPTAAKLRWGPRGVRHLRTQADDPETDANELYL